MTTTIQEINNPSPERAQKQPLHIKRSIAITCFVINLLPGIYAALMIVGFFRALIDLEADTSEILFVLSLVMGELLLVSYWLEMFSTKKYSPFFWTISLFGNLAALTYLIVNDSKDALGMVCWLTIMSVLSLIALISCVKHLQMQQRKEQVSVSKETSLTSTTGEVL
jgi:lipid-A-disaccharide synthase-like uncharacterized protein